MNLKFCAVCGSQDELHRHHFLPRTLGGSDSETNMLTLCQECHALLHGIGSHTTTLTRKALQQKKAANERVGTIQYGYQLAEDKIHLENNAKEQSILSIIHSYREAGYSYRKIADELNRNGYHTRRGSSWRKEYVRNILKPKQKIKSSIQL